MKTYQKPQTKVTVVNMCGPIASSLTVNEKQGNGTQLSKHFNMNDDDDYPSIWK